MLILKRLGLTHYQGMVFLSLEQSGITNANSVARVSRVPREKVYGVLNALMEMGLVNKVLTTPAMYKALPLDEAVAVLMDLKLKTHKELHTELSVLLQDYKSRRIEIPQDEELSNFEHVPGKEAVFCYTRKLIENVESRIDVVITWKSLLRLPFFVDSLRKAKERGVKIRIVVQVPEDSSRFRDLIQSIDMSFCECKIISFAPSAIIQIYDESKAILCTIAGHCLKESPAIFTGNSSFLTLANTYFKDIWLTSQLYKNENNYSDLKQTQTETQIG
jgi:sugar-specific transcriptional regulator TrmB